MNRFYIGLHHPSDAWPFARVMLSINALKGRLRIPRLNHWILDSGAFTEISTHGQWRFPPEDYADQINALAEHGTLEAAVCQDMMCEPFILKRTGLSVAEHQEITVKRYRRLLQLTSTYVMPVLQGYDPRDYLRHLEMYDLDSRAWVGVGSVCKRNSKPEEVLDVLFAIKSRRPNLLLHGFGLKKTALEDPTIRGLLESSDSMAWSYAERRKTGDPNDPRNALHYASHIQGLIDTPMFIQPILLQWWA